MAMATNLDTLTLTSPAAAFHANTDRGMMRNPEAVDCSDREAVLANSATATIDEEQWFDTRFGSPEVGVRGETVLNISTPVSYCVPHTARCAAGLHTTHSTIVSAFNAVKIIAMLICVFGPFLPMATGDDGICVFPGCT